MAAYFLDIDGTTTFFGTNEPIPGAIEKLKELLANGDQLIFTTQRPEADSFKQMLWSNGITSGMVITNVSSPRVLVNDNGAVAIKPETNSPWWE